jgi:predicted transcriptional regulator
VISIWDKVQGMLIKTDLAKVCKVLLNEKINGAGVSSARNRIIGIISNTDVVQAIATMN